MNHMPMIHVETVKAVQELLKDRGVEQRQGETWSDYVARGLGVSGAKAEAFLEALHRGCSVREAQSVAGIGNPGAMVKAAQAIGRTLGRMRRPAVVPRPAGWRWHPKRSDIGATEDQVNMSAQVPQRIDARGTKVEDLVGVGRHDSQGG
jgi:hypothetical protein